MFANNQADLIQQQKFAFIHFLKKKINYLYDFTYEMMDKLSKTNLPTNKFNQFYFVL